MLEGRAIPVFGHVLLLSRQLLSPMFVPFIGSSVAMISPVAGVSPAVSCVLDVVLPTSIVLPLVFVQEVRGERPLVPHAPHLFPGEVPSIIISEPIAWVGFFLSFAPTVTAFSFVPVMVVSRSCHVDLERELQLAPDRMIAFHHVDGREWLCVYLHGKLAEDQSALLYRHLDLPTQLHAVVCVMGERVMPLAVWSPISLLHRRDLMTFG